VRLPLPDGHQGFALVVAGQILESEMPLSLNGIEPAAMIFNVQKAGSGPSDLRLLAGPAGAQVVVFSGSPIGEPVVPWGPFVGTTRAEVAAYGQAFQAGAMGELAPSFSR
jgi:redox-sensitive bicupin YhaK (pirin superfamily)